MVVTVVHTLTCTCSIAIVAQFIGLCVDVHVNNPHYVLALISISKSSVYFSTARASRYICRKHTTPECTIYDVMLNMSVVCVFIQ